MNKRKIFISFLSLLLLVISVFLYKNINESLAEKTTTVSEVMSKDDIIKYYASNNSVGIVEAKNKLFKERNNKTDYKIIRKKIAKKSILELYVAGKTQDNKFNVEKILYSEIKNGNKIFIGNIYTNIENGKMIYYDIEGNLNHRNIDNQFLKFSSDIYAHISVSGRVYLEQ